MPRPIDADALKDKLMYLPGGYAQSFAGKACLMAIDDTPTLDYAPVRHGEWILKHVGYGHYWECSECHTNPCIYVTENTKFCPNCGAKMDGEEDENA